MLLNKRFRYALLMASLVSASATANTSSINIEVRSQISSQCIVKAFDVRSADITYSGAGQPKSKALLSVYSNSQNPITFSFDYTASNLRFENGELLTPGKDVFFTVDGKSPIAKEGTVFSNKQDENGSWNELFHITTAQGITKDMLQFEPNIQLLAEVRIRCPKQ